MRQSRKTRTIEVDFQIHQLIELARQDFDESPNDALRRLLGLRDHPDDDAVPGPTPPELPEPRTPRPPPKIRDGMLRVAGKELRHRYAVDAMVLVLTELELAHPGLLERCARDPANRGSGRRRIARRPEELHPNRPDLEACHRPLPGGWCVDTNLNNKQKRNVIDMAARLAGVRIGTDIVVPALGIVGSPPRKRKRRKKKGRYPALKSTDAMHRRMPGSFGSGRRR